MEAFKGLVDRIITEEDGQGMVEYALIAALIAVALIGALGLLGGGIEGAFDAVTEELPEAGG